MRARFILVIIAALSLGGCVNGRLDFSLLQKAVTFATATIDNPVTPQRLYQVEQGMIAATEGLLIYKRSCVRQILDQSCRAVIEQIQVYTRHARDLLPRLRRFVRNNDQVNAIKVYKEVQGILTDIKAHTAAGAI